MIGYKLGTRSCINERAIPSTFELRMKNTEHWIGKGLEMLLYSICCHYSCEPQCQFLKLKNWEWMDLQTVYFVTHCEALVGQGSTTLTPYFAIRVTVWYMAVKQPSSSLPQPSHQYQCTQKLPEVFVFNVKSYQDDYLRDFTTLRLYQLSYINISIVNIKKSIQYQNINCLISIVLLSIIFHTT